jgi:hypothetical protein
VESGGLGDTVVGRIGDECLCEDCCFSDISSFIKIIMQFVYFFSVFVFASAFL